MGVHRNFCSGSPLAIPELHNIILWNAFSSSVWRAICQLPEIAGSSRSSLRRCTQLFIYQPLNYWKNPASQPKTVEGSENFIWWGEHEVPSHNIHNIQIHGTKPLSKPYINQTLSNCFAQISRVVWTLMGGGGGGGGVQTYPFRSCGDATWACSREGCVVFSDNWKQWSVTYFLHWHQTRIDVTHNRMAPPTEPITAPMIVPGI